MKPKGGGVESSAKSSKSPLESSGKALFFAVANLADLALSRPRAHGGLAVRTWARLLGGMQKEAVVASTRSSSAWRLASDEGACLMGDDVAPCPLSFLTTGMTASFMDEILSLAGKRGLRISDIGLVQDNFYTMTGSILRGTMAGGALPVGLTVEIDTDVDSRSLSIHDAIERSPVTGLVRAYPDHGMPQTTRDRPGEYDKHKAEESES